MFFYVKSKALCLRQPKVIASELRRIVRIGRFPVQTLLGARLALGTQPRYGAPGDLQVENVKRSD